MRMHAYSEMDTIAYNTVVAMWPGEQPGVAC